MPLSSTDQLTVKTTLHLALLKKGDSALVTKLSDAGTPDQGALRTRLLELGFVPGEKIRVVAESFPGRDPIAVRLGNSTFALRRHEAALVQVVLVERVGA